MLTFMAGIKPKTLPQSCRPVEQYSKKLIKKTFTATSENWYKHFSRKPVFSEHIQPFNTEITIK